MSLGAFFNDRNFTERIGEVKILEKKTAKHIDNFECVNIIRV